VNIHCSDQTALSGLNVPAALTLARYRSAPGRMVMPDVCCDLVWARGRLMLAGPMTVARQSSNAGQNVTLLRLDPLVACQWLRIPLRYFTDKQLPLADVDPSLARDVEICKGEDALECLVPPAGEPGVPPVDARMAAASTALRRGTPVSQVAALVALSERQLERRFVETFGMGPKTFARILRFRKTIAAVKQHAPLAEAAAVGGYADQPHFTREVKALTGRSPRAVLPHVGNIQDVAAGRM
jgi:AraC-like DNA-binding protein